MAGRLTCPNIGAVLPFRPPRGGQPTSRLTYLARLLLRCPETRTHQSGQGCPLETWGPGVSSSRCFCRIFLTVSQIIVRRLTGSRAMTSAEFLARLWEDGSIDSPSAIWRIVVHVRDEKGYKLVVLLLARVQNCNYYPCACALYHMLCTPLWHVVGYPYDVNLV